MSSTALRAVRELRGEDATAVRPGTSSGGRPGTSSGMRLATPEDTTHPSIATTAATSVSINDLRKELEDVRLALDKEKRNNRALEQYLAEVTESKDNEIKEALTETKQAQASLQRAEAHAISLEEVYKAQLAKLTLTVERLQSKSHTPKEAEEAFSEVLRDEMRSMQAAYQLKLDRAQSELQSRTQEYGKQIRQLNEALTDERRKNTAMLDRISRGPISPTAASAASARPTSGSSSTSTLPAKSTATPTTTTAKSSGGLSARGTPAASNTVPKPTPTVKSTTSNQIKK